MIDFQRGILLFVALVSLAGQLSALATESKTQQLIEL